MGAQLYLTDMVADPNLKRGLNPNSNHAMLVNYSLAQMGPCLYSGPV